jgi:ABC-type Na+ efflux pump permease subunit
MKYLGELVLGLFVAVVIIAGLYFLSVGFNSDNDVSVAAGAALASSIFVLAILFLAVGIRNQVMTQVEEIRQQNEILKEQTRLLTYIAKNAKERQR